MRKIAAIVALVGSSLPASGEVSQDLKFCGERKSAAERLACFEAVTRGTALKPAARHTTRVAPRDALTAAPLKAPALEPLPARSPFDGYYAAIGGGYGVGSGRDNGVSGNLITNFVPITSMSGPNVTGVLGRNIAFGWGLVGLELDARWSKEQGTRTTAVTNQFPYVGTAQFTYRYTNDAGIHAMIRVGATFDDLLVFARAGVGATRISESFIADEQNVRECLTFSGGSCIALGVRQGSFGAVAVTSWLPSAIFGIGAEQNWGPVYARLGADLEAFNHAATTGTGANVRGSSSATQIMWTTRGVAMIGIRF